jgi:UDP-2,4-diacetamido-2,4,6-trideoxy-beta-L-altropyranose hydrolase
MMISSAKTLTVASRNPRFDRRRNLWIRTAAGPQIGFGHLRRCVILARTLQDCCVPAFLLDSNDLWSLEQVTGEGWNSYCRGLDEIWAVMPDPLGILIDSRLIAGLDRLIQRAKDRRIPVISIHDLGLNPLPSDIVIDGSITAFSGKAPSRDAVSFSGTDYMVLDPSYGRLHRRKKEIRGTIRSVFINLGGGDSERFFLKVLKGLKLRSRELEVVGVPGFISQMQERLCRQDWKPLHLRWENRGIERYLAEADLAITAGGLAAYEALCSGTPLLALSYDSLQQATIKGLADKNACLDLGPGTELEPSKLCEALSLLDSDFELRKRLSICGKQIVDGRGAERVSQIVRHTIQMFSAADQGRVPIVTGIGI